ncbi:Uncharacterised protein [Amycolatopsis camponoti]|uniref:Uncharacterized protein n=1 Tax=Amycolatopsis camponoti TaxID=2606593 RepID=A0A6I8MAH6_9PSEU|nr:hypothetical protein [Amycolatopsis camponoti]VVJ24865.1 Uncharacterised protein [Amycolatopsis camponoti]
MVEPISLTLAIAAFVGPIVVALVVLTIGKIIDWFTARRRIPQTNRDVIGVVLAKRLNDKDYVEVPGVFSRNRSSTQLVQAFYDQRSGTVLDARAISSSRTSDRELIRKTAEGDGMIVFT